MNFWFTIKEGLKGFKRARLSSTITITSIAFSHVLIGVFLILSLNLDQWISEFRSRMELEVFIESGISEKSGRLIKDAIASIEGVNQVLYLSKDQAAQRFKKEFGRDIYDVLDTNPLPASCTVTVLDGYRTARSVRSISDKIGQIDGVDEVIYQKDLLALIDHYLKIIYLAGGIIGLFLVVIAVVLLYNTVRLTIYARRDIIEIMNLVGATDAFIRRPFLVEGFIQGLTGALLANFFIYLIIITIKSFIYPYLVFKPEIYVILVLFGIMIGLFSSKMSISKHLKYI
ncbi:MAG: cell division protein FtsX [Calditrichaceae bacterium]